MMTTSKAWRALETRILPRVHELLAWGRQAQERGETLNAYRWAFVEAMKERDDYGVRRGTLQYRFAQAVIDRMLTDWAQELG